MCCSFSNFNSIKVRLNLTKDLSFYALPSVFQFHKGTIKPQVRATNDTSRQPFQFHKGTIKPALLLYDSTECWAFQFHKGTIKPLKRLTTNNRNCYFNSIKVRLNPGHSMEPKINHGFQFHKGTIKPMHNSRIMHVKTHFNSIKVRLNRQAHGGTPHGLSLFQFHKGTIKPAQTSWRVA